MSIARMGSYNMPRIGGRSIGVRERRVSSPEPEAGQKNLKANMQPRGGRSGFCKDNKLGGPRP